MKHNKIHSPFYKLEIIKNCVVEYTQLDITSTCRKRPYVYARALYFQLSRDFTRHSLQDIGAMVNKDHASVLHGLKTFKLFYIWEEKYWIELYHVIRLKFKKEFNFANRFTHLSVEEKFDLLLHHHINLKEKYYKLKETKEKIT